MTSTKCLNRTIKHKSSENCSLKTKHSLNTSFDEQELTETELNYVVGKLLKSKLFQVYSVKVYENE